MIWIRCYNRVDFRRRVTGNQAPGGFQPRSRLVDILGGRGGRYWSGALCLAVWHEILTLDPRWSVGWVISQGRTMGLFSFLGGKKKEKALAGKPAPVAEAGPSVTEKKAEAALARAASVAAAPQVIVTATGVAQAKLRLKLAASLRAGERTAAYEAAKGLADIQAKAGRRVGARVWSVEAERIKSGIAA